MKPEISVGNVVFSKKGRDKGRVFVVLLSLDADFVMIADGDTRKLDRPKKKRRRHLTALPAALPGIISLHEKNLLKDADLREALKAYKDYDRAGGYTPEQHGEG